MMIHFCGNLTVSRAALSSSSTQSHTSPLLGTFHIPALRTFKETDANSIRAEYSYVGPKMKGKS